MQFYIHIEAIDMQLDEYSYRKFNSLCDCILTEVGKCSVEEKWEWNVYAWYFRCRYITCAATCSDWSFSTPFTLDGFS